MTMTEARAVLAGSARRVDVLVAAATVGALGYVATVDPNQPGHYPLCPVRALSGWYCPGCGGLRSVHALLHGDVRTAIHDNAAVWVAIPALVVALVLWRRGRLTQAQVAVGGLVLFVALLGFAVLRNLPGFEALRPL